MTFQVVPLRKRAEAIMVTADNAVEVARFVGAQVAVVIPNLQPGRPVAVLPGQFIIAKDDGKLYRCESSKRIAQAFEIGEPVDKAQAEVFPALVDMDIVRDILDAAVRWRESVRSYANPPHAADTLDLIRAVDAYLEATS